MPDMRFAPPNPLRIADRATGLNSVSVRSYNERLVLSLLLQRDATTRLEIGEKTGLSAQTISVLVRSLEQEGLVAKGVAQKGRVGPPTVPIALNPEGAFSVGVSIGHTRTDVVLIDFVGAVRFSYTLPNPEKKRGNQSEFLETIQRAVAMIPQEARNRIAGVGLALPYKESAGRAADQHFADLQAEIEEHLGIPVFVQNDITAAAGGESMFGAAKPLTDYMYFYLGAKLHGRLVLNHQIYHGNSSVDFDVGISALERLVAQRGFNAAPLWDGTPEWPDYGAVLDDWTAAAADQIERTVHAVGQFVELEAVVLSSPAPASVCDRIRRTLQERPQAIPVVVGAVRVSPKAVGAASLPFSSRFTVEPGS